MVERPNERPGHLDLTGTAFTDQQRIPLSSPGDLAPPKTGEIPPALSPLDAFAFQSRLLAKKFEEEQDGKRLSRLPHLTIQNEFARRPGYFRSASSEASSAFGESSQDDSPNTGFLKESPMDARPQSMYPSFEDGDVSASPRQPMRRPVLAEIGEEETETPHSFPTLQPITRPTDYFEIPRAASPEQIETRVERPTPETPSSRTEERQTSPLPNFDALSIGSVASPNQGLRPPRSPLAFKNSPSIRSVYDSSLDDVDTFSMGSVDSLPPGKPSTSSSYSRSHSPAIPFQVPLPRSPSVQSESSWTSGPRPSFNFSRPLSAVSRPSLDRRTTNESTSLRQGTMDSTSDRQSLDVPSRQDTGELPLTPMTLTSEDSFTGDHDTSASHYTYSKYPLPRGRPLNRESIAPGEFILQQFQWDNSLASGRISLSRSPSPNPRRPYTPPYSHSPPQLSKQRKSEDTRTTSSGSPRQRRTLHKANRSSPSHLPDKSHPYLHSSASSTITSSDASTIKAQLGTSKPSSIMDLTPEQHLQKGIELHEAGSLQKSTYHLRGAAQAGDPTPQRR